MNTPNTQKGFTMVESLVAVTILVVAMAGPLTIAQKGLATASFAKDQVTAFFLAQDLVESILVQRSSNVIAGDNWLTGLSSCIGVVCSADTINWLPTVCAGGTGTCENLRFSNSTHMYGHDPGWTLTKFNREFTLSQVPLNSNELALDIKITWTTGLLSKEINIREHIFNWH